MKHDLFISYSRKDFEEVNTFKQLLESRLDGLKCWFDITGIESGDEFDTKIIDAIDSSQFVLFALSDHSIDSTWSKMEIMYAKNTNKRIIPVLLKGAEMKGWFLFQFGRIDCIDITNVLQVNKFITNLASWCKLNQQTASESGFKKEEQPINEAYEKGCQAEIKKRYRIANEWFIKAVFQGNVQAMVRLGHNYNYGLGVPLDYKKANEYYLMAVEQGDRQAMAYLALNYKTGRGVPLDYEKSEYWENKSKGIDK